MWTFFKKNYLQKLYIIKHLMKAMCENIFKWYHDNITVIYFLHIFVSIISFYVFDFKWYFIFCTWSWKIYHALHQILISLLNIQTQVANVNIVEISCKDVHWETDEDGSMVFICTDQNLFLHSFTVCRIGSIMASFFELRSFTAS